MMSLIGFHRVLIGFAIAFCFGFAAWELVHYWITGDVSELVLGLVFVVFGVLLSIYLRSLRRFLGQEEKEEDQPPDPSSIKNTG